jgi:peroxiredoxin
MVNFTLIQEPLPMKPISALLLFLLSFSISFAQKGKGYDIKFTVKGLKEGSNCILAHYHYNFQLKKDSVKSNAKGEFEFKGEDKYPEGMYLIIFPNASANKKYFDFVMDESQNFVMETDTLDYVQHMKVKDSEQNQLFFEYQHFISQKQKQIEPLRERYKKVKNNKDSAKIVQEQMSVIDKEVKAYKANVVKNNPQKFIIKLLKATDEPEIPETPLLPDGKKDTLFPYHYYKTHFWDNFDFSDERMLRTPVFHPKIKQYLDKLTPQIPDSINIGVDYLIEKGKANPEVFKYLVNLLVYDYESSKRMGFDAVFVHIVDKYYKTGQVTWLDSTRMYKVQERAFILKPLLLGKKAPPIMMQDSTGKTIALYDVKANYTIVVFWDYGCGHCKKDIPALSDLYKTKLKKMGVEVYAVETDNGLKEWKKFIRDYDLNWINVIEQDDYKRAVTKKIYDIYKTPIIYLLDQNKIIKAKQIDNEQLVNFIEMLEKEKNKEKK